MAFPTSLIGDAYTEGRWKWANGALASDGCIYAAPARSDQILKIDPQTKKTELVGPKIEGNDMYVSKYFGAVAPKDGYVYFVPCNAPQVLKFNIQTLDVTDVGARYEGDFKWQDAAMGKNGSIYCAPFLARQILKINTNDNSTSLVGDDLGKSARYSSAVASIDGATIYFISFEKDPILKYDVGTEKIVNHIDVDHLNTYGWSGGVCGPDGCIYGIPYHASRILKYNPQISINHKRRDDYNSNNPENPTLVGDHFGDATYKWYGGVLVNDCIYGIPHRSSKVFRYNTLSGTTTFDGNDYFGGDKWCGGVHDNSDNIFAIPRYAEKVLQIIPSLFSSQTNNGPSYQSGGIDDSPINQIDRLGYELYAKALVDHIISVERTGEAISVGIFSPWGSGKSFFWDLTKKEFKKQSKQMRAKKQGDIDADSAATDNNDDNNAATRQVQKLLEFFRGVRKDVSMWWEETRDEIPDIFLNCYIIITSFLTMVVEAVILFFWRVIGCWWEDARKEIPIIFTNCCKIITSFLTMVVEAVILFFRWVIGCIAILFSVLFCYYKRGHWKMPSEERNEESPTRIYVEFDAWTYRGTDNLWASMLEKMWKEVEKELGEEKVKWHRAGIALANNTEDASQDESPKEREEKEEREEKARQKLQIQWNASIAFFSWALLAFIAVAAYLIYIHLDQQENQDSSNDFSYLYGASISLATAFATLLFKLHQIKTVYKPGINNITNKLKTHKRKDFKQEVGFMGIVRSEVNYLIEFLKLYNARIVLFVDDLDRCNQKVAMDVLWAISLLFGSTKGPITSFLAVDTKVLVDYIEKDFDGNVNGYRYLEKIFNLPFSIPPIDKDGKVKFCERAIRNREFEVSQVYGKAIISSLHEPTSSNAGPKKGNLVKDLNLNFVDHMSLETLRSRNENKMVADLIKFGENMNKSGLRNLAGIDTHLLDRASVPGSTAREELLYVLLDKLDYLDLDADAEDDDADDADLYGYDHNHGLLYNSPSSPFPSSSYIRNNTTNNDHHDGQRQDHHSGNDDDDDDDALGISSQEHNNNNISSSVAAGAAPLPLPLPSPSNMNGEPAVGVGVGVDNNVDDSINIGASAISKQQPIYECKGMVTPEERKFIKKYAHFLDGLPRKMKRVLNVYNVSRYILNADTAAPSSISLEKLFVFTILQELCPYRTSWLVFISQCAAAGTSSFEKSDESLSFISLLDDLRNDPSDASKPREDLPLPDVFARIVCGVLHCLPSAAKQIEADSGSMQYGHLLEHLSLGDLYPDRLQRYMFNLPRNMLTEIKMYRNHCVICKREVKKKNDNGNYWVATFRKMVTQDNAKTYEEERSSLLLS